MDSITYREARLADISLIMVARGVDQDWPPDHRTAAYLQGDHHPTDALLPRVIFVALDGAKTVGYMGGHLTRRYDCDGELQYLWVDRAHRRRGIAARLGLHLSRWFEVYEVRRVCVDDWLVWERFDEAFVYLRKSA